MNTAYQFGKPDPQHPAIVVLREAYPGAPLADNEFFALMVADPAPTVLCTIRARRRNAGSV